MFRHSVFKFLLLLFVLSGRLNSQISIAMDSTLCNGDFAYVTVNTNSVSLISYTWSCVPAASLIAAPNASATSISFPSPGLYTLALTANSASGTNYAYQTVTVSPNPTLNLSSSSPSICFLQGSTLTVNGASSYTWAPVPGMYFLSNSVAYISPGATTNYSVIGTNSSGCMGMTSVTQYVFMDPALILTSSSGVVCPGYSSTIIAMGASSYTWSGTTFTGSVIQPSIVVGAGSYTVIGGNGGICFDTTVIVLQNSAPLSILVSATRSMMCLNPDSPESPVVLTASGGNTYLWAPYSPAHMSYSLGSVTAVTPTSSTCYTVVGSTSVCSGTALVCVNVSECTGLEKDLRQDFCTLFPNPVKDELYLSFDGREFVGFELSDMFGKILISREFDFTNTDKRSIILSEIPAGIYFVRLNSSGHSVQIKRVIKV